MSEIEDYTRLGENGITITFNGGDVEIVDWEQITRNTIEFCESQFSEIDEINTIADRLIEVAAALRKANNVGGK